MLAKVVERGEAVKLRKQGLSYGEILKLLPVSKSSLSLWLRTEKLSNKYNKLLVEKRHLAQIKGGQAKREQRLIREKTIKGVAFEEIGEISERDLKLIGIALYWAEGAKQKKHHVSQRVAFSNSDPFMIKLFIRWLKDICNIKTSDILLELFIHESGDLEKAKGFWSGVLNIDQGQLRTYFKKHKITNRKNVGDDYNGLIRISVRRSTDLNRKISGWIQGISV